MNLKAFEYESALQSRLIKVIEEKYKNDVWVFKSHDMIRVGIPDLLICFYGHFVAIELKRALWKRTPTGRHPKGRSLLPPGVFDAYRMKEKLCEDTTPMQRYNIRKINKAGGSAFVGRNISVIMVKLDEIFKSLKLFEAHL